MQLFFFALSLCRRHWFSWVCAALLSVSLSSCLYYKDLPLEQLKPKFTNNTSQFVRVDGMNVHYRADGSEWAQPVLLLHGAGASLHTWDAWVDSLQYEFRVIRLDLPGFGLTGTHPQANYTVEAYRDFVKKFLETLNIKKCHVVGNGLGGRVAWELALQYPLMVRKLVLMDALGYPKSELLNAKAFRMARGNALSQAAVRWLTPKSLVRKTLLDAYGDAAKVQPDLVARYHQLALITGNRRAFIDRARLEDYDRSWRIKQIEHPTLIVWGAEDKVVPVEHASFFRRDLKQSELLIYKGVGHLPMEEAPAESVADAIRFLKTPAQ